MQDNRQAGCVSGSACIFQLNAAALSPGVSEVSGAHLGTGGRPGRV